MNTMPISADAPRKLKIVLPGYLPASKNRKNGRHWSQFHAERNKAETAILLWLDSLLPTESTLVSQWTSTIRQLKSCRIPSENSTSSQETIGTNCKAG